MAGRYATALFELARENDAIEQVSGDLGRFNALLDASPDLVRLVRSPMFSAEAQTKALDSILAAHDIGGLSANFLRLVTANRRLFAVRDIIKAFRALVLQHRGEVSAQVTVAEPLAPKHLEALQQALKESTGKNVSVDVKVDPAIIGGLVVKLGSRMIDTSLRTKLNSMKHAMKEVG